MLSAVLKNEPMFVGLRTYVRGLTHLCSWPHEPMFTLRATMRCVFWALMMLAAGSPAAWAQAPVEITTAGEVTDHTEKTYFIQSYQNTAYYLYPVSGSGNYMNTRGILDEKAEFYFLDAGTEADVQYYYIVNKNSGKYLYASANTSKKGITCIDYNADNDDKYKFGISAATGISAYNIFPKGNTALSLNKQTGNWNTKGPNAEDVFLYATFENGKAVEGSSWNFILTTSYSWTLLPECFNLSSAGDSHYYYIQNNSTKRYMVPGTTNVESATKTDDNDAQARWYFLKAASDTYVDYYYIVNVNGEYLYTTGTQGADAVNNVVSLKGHTTAGGLQEERFQFIVVRGAMSNESHNDPKKITFTIIPRVFKDVRSENYWGLEDNSAGPLRTFKERNGNDKCHWNFISASPICETPVITYTGFNQLTISSATDGATIYYTTDGTTPTTSSNLYEGPITITAGMTAIKAIATKADYDPSVVATQALATYTYKIVNRSNVIAATSEEVQQAAGKALNGYTDIPASILSSYISDETVTFYAMDGDFNAANLDDEHRITETPAASATIYVTYTTTHLAEKFLPLTKVRPYNLRKEDSYLYGNGGLGTNASPAEGDKTSNAYLWYFLGSDPYNVTIQNVGEKNYLNYASSTLSLSTEQTFILKNLTTEDATTNVTLRNASGEEVTLEVKTVELSLRFTLIDQAGKLIESGISADGGLVLPDDWRSPLVSQYKFYKNATQSGDVYTLSEDDLITSIDQRDGDVIYVTYDVNTELIDLDGRDLLNNRGGAAGKAYRLEFTGGTAFNQENGSDGIMDEARTPKYPYSNGDAQLYVYGSERWEDQLASGASTRTRWLWYLEPANGHLDPYHVKISSYQTQTSYKVSDSETRNFHSYLRTYKPEGYSGIVTGVTNSNPLEHGKAANADADKSDATEYMLLGTSLNSMKIKTTYKVDDGSTDERRTIDTFEQYWKNNPTAYNLIREELGHGVLEGTNVNTALPAAEQKVLTDQGWHVYSSWANAANWSSNARATKSFGEGLHWYQTVEMGDGTMTFVETELQPMLILLDQHGWEIVRLPLPSGPTDPKRAEIYANIHKYSSPMVARYHFWKTGSKVPGYHKYTVSDYATVSDVDLTEYTADELGRADITNPSTPANLPNYETQALVSGKERDWYVTYDVKPKYVNSYTPSPTAAGTSAPFYVKQGDLYAWADGTALASNADPDFEDPKYHWNLIPNFNIDEEMGYLYDVEDEDGNPISKEQTNQNYYDDGQAGFDPYNVQIHSAATTTRYFTANTSDSKLDGGAWIGSTSGLTLENMNTSGQTVQGNDQTTLKITNATFMVVDDGNGNMLLMPRFDHSHVLNSLTETQFVAAGSNTNSLYVDIVPQVVHSSSEIGAMGGSYVLADGFTSSAPVGTSENPFAGTIDGMMRTISLDNPLVAYARDAVIKNVMVESASVSGGTDAGNVGAIVCEATGDTRIYNCGINGGSVSGSNYVGGLVGLLDGYSRVINCYSYADITGGSYVGGIVGYNNFASTSSDIRTMVMNCMFYGDITGGSNKAPIYNGLIISNKDSKGLGNYNYFLAQAPYVQADPIQIDTYNCALMADTLFLKRFEFFRLLMNSHLELAGWYATGKYDKSEMMKWVLETADRQNDSPMLYPVLKTPDQYPSIINIDAANAPISGERNTGKKLGTLTVNISGPGSGAVYGAPTGASITTSSLELNITDKDFDRYNFNYRKVQLPYYNDVGEGNYTGNRVVTGWKITSISGGTSGTFKAEDSAEGYNFADRNCTDKDLYGKSGRVFNQGAYWDVPEDVTAITIEPYWAKAAYVADGYADVVYNQEMSTKYDVPNVGGGQRYTDGGEYSIAGDRQKVYTSIGSAIGSGDSQISANKTVYDHAIVLVGNYHEIISKDNAIRGSNVYTVTTIDQDGDNEPDYSFMFRNNGRNKVHPVRYDFLNFIGLGMAQKSTGGTGTYNFGIMLPIGWFESTNTSLFRVTQFEYDNKDRVAAPLILQGGVMEQWVSGQNKGVSNNTTYFHVGGNVWFKEFHRGTHQDNAYASKHPPVSVTGGDYDEFYLTGLYKAVTTNNDNAECYINGGRFGIVAGTGLEGLGDATNHTNGNIVWQIQNADINEFYGGGINAASPIQGNITTVITDSHVKQFCGGPKFGDMREGKTVTTTATGCTFGTYFGAGYGGNSYSRQAPKNFSNKVQVEWNKWIKGLTRAENDNNFNGYQQEYKNLNYSAGIFEGVSTQFSYQFLPMSDNTTNVGRLFIDYVKFSLATTRTVTSTLNGCTVTGNFYGGGKLGKVDGDVTSTLTNCTVHGNAFGAGYSADLPTVEADDTQGFETEPSYNTETGTYSPGVKGPTTTYTWAQKTGNDWIDKTKHILYTNEDLTTLGTVTGQVTLNIDGTTTIGGNVDGGNVYGGGESSDATGDVNVNILNGTMTNVYGGGKGKTTVVGGDITVNIGAKSDDATPVYTGTGTVRNVYGGSALGAVNATKGEDDVLSATAGKTTTVNVYAGTVSNVFGGGLGEKTESSDIAAQNFGNTKVIIENSDNTKAKVTEAIYGGANINGVIKADAEVTLTGGTVGTAPGEGEAIGDAVFGGGKGAPTLVNGNVTVNVGTLVDSVRTGSAVINGHVYGGSALGNTNASKPADELVFNADQKTYVNLYAGTINGYAFGGGLGRQEAEGVEPVESFVGGDVLVTLDGAKVQQVFGANNLNGTPKGHVKVWVKRTNNFDASKNALKENDETALADRTTYDVDAVYGGGNQADYNPTKATGSEDDKKEAFSEVLIEGCDETSIKDVYGGGNAAAVPADSITILSCYIIDQVFGGGNGAGAGNPGADVGVIDKTAYASVPTTGIYGTGVAKTTLVGGQIHYVYGGSNTLGNVRGGTQLKRSESNTCELKVGEIYGAGQVAPMDGDVNIILECMPEDYVDAVYGGAKNAVVNGNVSLTVTSGKYGRVFGGNNEGGSINGSIIVIAKEEGCKPLEIGELYGGGNEAPYSRYGCTYEEDSEIWTPSTTGTDYTDGKDYAIEVIVESCTSIGKVFGGGNKAKVIGNTHVEVNLFKGIVDNVTQEEIGKIGQIFGGGNLANVVGNITVDVGTDAEYKDPDTGTIPEGQEKGVTIIHGDYINPDPEAYKTTERVAISAAEAGVYGGGNDADVEGNTTLNIGTAEQSLGINITGNIFGGGLGETTTVTGDVTVNIGKEVPAVGEGSPTYEGYATITGDVYGGSAKGKVNATKGEGSPFTANAGKTTQVNLYGGTLTGNVYGGGLGEDNDGTETDYAADVYGPVTVNVYGGKVDNVFGCNNVLGSPKSTATVNINGTPTPEAPATYIISNVYGGGNQAAYNGTGGVSVVMNNGYVNNVYGGGLGTTATVNGATTVTLDGGTVKHDVYGGGSQGDVTGAVTVSLNGGTVENDVYGGGALALTNTAYEGANETYRTYVTNVTLAGSTVTGSVYGGGLGQLATAAVLYTAEDAEVIAGTKTEGDVKTPAMEAVAANVVGPVTVTVTGGKAANVFGCNNIYGAPQQTVAVAVNGTAEPVAPATYAIANVYGGGNQAAYTGNPTVAISGGFVNDVFGGGLGATAIVTGSPSVTVSGGTVANDVFGGGSQADVTGNVTVSITGGTVVNDVYGGGALANTNTANWNAGSDTWAEGMTSASNVTNVTLTGGTVGNVYGGGLGAHAVGTVGNPGYTAAIEPKVYGDITVAVNPDIDPDPDVTQYGTARFLRAIETHDYEGTYKDADNVEHTQITTGTVYTKGCVFGANNKEGTPKGNIQVTVWSTTPAEGATREYGIYEIQNVYGGGNLSAYEPAAGKTTRVDIHGCDRTSIQFVFGGGNAASVPETNVTIWGSYEIETVFGGGNGSEPFWDRAEEKWVVSPGAAVTTSNVYLKGGYIHSAFGGSYERGTVEHTNIDKSGTAGECVLRVTDVFGGGKDADVEGGINIIISDCTGGLDDLVDEGQSTEYIKNVYAGSYNARVFGPVVLTVTSGVFTNVFGGNHTSGFINGPITINIEETEDCKPVIIDNLYGGGNFAHYPGLGANYATPKITINVKAATRIGNIFGGCNHADVTGDTEININMIKGWWAGKTYDEETIPNTIGTIGNVYGGGNEGRVIGNTAVNIGTVTGIKVMKRDGDNQILATDGLVLYDNEGKVREGAVPDSTDVIPVLGAHITGNVYGGCNFDDVTGNSTVNLCTANYSGVAGFAGVDIDNGSVYGGGNHGNVLGNTNVTMAGGYVYDGVYGGGLYGSVGTFTRSLPSGHPAHADCIGGKPDVFTPNTGKCTVVVSGGQVGPAEVATEGMKKAGGPIHKGFVFGAGRGDVENPADDPDADFQTYVYETDVTIKNKYEDGYEGGATDSLSHVVSKPLIMASVYGGGENGRVRGNTFVKIYGGQIGCGEGKVEAGKPVAYDEADFIDPTTSTASAIIAKADEMKECAHWDYGRDKNSDGQKEYLPYDPYAAASDLDDDIVGSDGHTYYGSVFGGGSGYYPYRRSDGTHEWLRSAGLVEGNTKVHISGGHILTNVYGGNELTDVNGSCTVTMTGGTIGIPRTLAGIADHPVTCYLFGAGKGDQRTHFNQWTDVDSTNVTVSGGIIYGSVFGGGEDGHIVGDAVVNIQGSAKIGTWGTSYVDGNVFGGGRGFSGEALTAGNVGGNVHVNISGGIMLGSIYGGGRLASVGYRLVQPESEYYGKLQDGTDHGYVNINISGGTIGNPYEFIIPSTADNAACGIAQADITQWTAADWTKWKTYKNIPYTEFVLDKGLELYRLTHTKGGNVFAGGMGRLDNLNGTPLAVWKELGKVKSTTLNITGGNIKGNVYGGGEMGLVGDIPAGAVAYAEQPVVSTVTITGGTIGTEVQSASVTQYTFGSVFGGGYGNTREKIDPAVADIPQDESDNPKFMSGRTHGSTQVSMSAGTVLGSIYGGGEVANVRGNASVAISGGTVGKDKVGERYFSGATMGNVFGGGSGTRTIVRCGQVFGNTSVNISEANPGTPTHIYHNIYGGGSYGSVGDINWTEAQDPNYDNAYKTTGVDGISTTGTGTATVVVTGGTIGVDGLENGFVFGSSRGEVADPTPRDNLMAWAYATNVTIGTSGSGTVTTTPLVKGSVYGGGENGHVWNTADVKVYSGTIGDPTSFVVNRGNVFGAGRGIEKYDSDDPDVIPESYNPEAGIVKGSTQVLIAGGQVAHNVYGAGAMGSVVGSTSVTVDGDAVIGDNLDNGTNDGNVFGAARGDIALNSPLNLAYVGSTTVTIAGGLVKNNVFGGGEAGVVKGSVVVNMNGGTVGKNLYGGGALSNTNTNNVTENYGADTGYTNPTETIPTTNTNTTAVNLLGGTIQGNAYGGGLGRRPLDAVGTPDDPDYEPAVEAIFAKVYGDVTVDLNNNNNGGQADGTKAGCAVTKVFGCNDMHGTPRGHVKVHVFATQHPNRTELATISSKYPLYANIDDYTISNYAGLTTLAATVGADVSAYTAILTDPAKDDDAKKTALADMREAISRKKYDVQAVYGGGDLARYEPVNAFSTDEAVRQSARVEVIIDGCALTSIHEVYGSGNASATPASSLTVYGCYEIDELFGGGNGKDPYQLDDGFWYANPGANVGYRNYTHYVKDGTHGDGSEANPYTAVENTDATSKEYRIANYAYGSGEAHTDVFGGRIHSAYGGSNMVGNIRFLAMSSYDSSTDCPSNIDHTYAGGNEADMDGKAELLAKCVGYMHKLYGGNTNSDYNNDIVMTITNGVFGTVIGGNDQGGKVSGSITINIKEGGCNPIIIDKLYGGGYEAGYSIYGYNKSDGSPRTKEDYDRDLAAAMATIPEADKNNETVVNNALIDAGLFGFPKASPRINIISATKIGEVYGGGYNSVVVGNPTINVNMEEGQVLKEYVDKNPSAFTNGEHTLTTNYHEGGIDVEREDDYAVVGSVAEGLAAGNAILKTGTIGNIFGGGDQADVIGNTTVEIGTGSWFNPDTHLTESVERKAAFVLGNVYGGGRMGNVGNFTKTAGKPTSCVDGTGIARVVISNGEIGPDNMKMYHADGSGVIPTDDKPDDSGHVFGGGMGTNAPADDNAAFVDSTEVIINGTAWVKGSVFGGGENGHVLHDAGVKIGGKAQIGSGHILVKDGSSLLVNQGINRRYTEAEWEAGHLILGDGDLPGVSDELKTSAQTMYANSLPECHSWEYKAPYAPYDKYAGTGGYDAKGGAKIATSGRAFNGNVFGGGSGFFPYEAGSWNPKAGQVEGDTWVEVTGGHIMTSLYGGSEMTSVTGDTHIIMSGGTVGVPRTLSEIAAHPVTCYVFGGGKGEERSYLDNVTTVNNAFVNVSGGWVYGSVFGGAEDGAVLGNAKVTIGGTTPSDTTTFAGLLAGSATKIGTWGTSYVDGNIFGGGRGYEGKNPKAGRVGGNINIDITGGRMLGSVYGGGRLGSVGIDGNGAMQVGDDHGIITINATGGVIGNDHEYTYSPDAALLSGTLKNTVFEDFTFNEKIADGESTTTVDEAADAVTIKKLYHTKGGSIYGGSMGRLTQLDGVTINPIWHQLGIAKATTINFSGNARVMSSLFGGSEFGKVSGDTHINVSGSPVIGTAVEKAGVPQYTFGSIYAGGYGSDYKLTDADKTAGATMEPRAAAGLVEGNTYLNMSENAKVLASVYGGGKLAVVNGNTDVRVSGGEVGLNLVRKGDGYVMFGGDGMGNVYGGGRGRLVDGGRDNGLGLVKGNTNVDISGGSIYHNVYGGGTLASVGTFHVSDGTTPSYIPLAGVPYDWTANTGTATVTVTGGTIGINGRDNGMVFGSSRGDLTLPVEEGGREIDPYDRMAWVNDSRVNIGTDGSPTGPHITGTVYGGGENGHNGHDATVSVYSGTVGIVDTADPWYSFADAKVNEKALLTRGNVYGAGCGTDTYTKDGEELHNPKAGMVGHSTTVNIQGGHIVRNVYGGGALGSVGMLSSDEGTKHDDAATSFALSWPYALEFAPGEDNGKATVNVTGGHIGLRQLDGGDIFGGARGEAGDRYATAHLAYVRESEVNVNYPSTPDLDALTYSGIQNDFSVPCITGSVHGSGENGFVYDDAHVNILNGLIGHSVYGGGKGKGTYTKRLSNIGGVTGPDGSDHHDAEIYSLIAGKVFGNTYVTMKDGRVGRNIYGGGNMGSVGKGNYAGGADDYYPSGYGEAITGNLWTSEAVGDNAWHFLNSGNTHVKVFGGEVGYIDPTNPENSMKNDLPYGNVFGGSAGEAAPNILEDPRYEYCPAFFSGYVNETDVTIGLTSEQFEANKDIEPYKTYGTYETYKTSGAPTILGSVYGGGQDGHVRRDTKVTVNSGEIGLPYTADNQSVLQTSDLDSPQWLHRGNVYGGGSGITKYKFDLDGDGETSTNDGSLSYNGNPFNEEGYSTSSGSVTRFTEVNILGGTIHRNVYGGGSMGSVGAPNLGQGYDPYKPGQANIEGKPANGPGRQSMNTVNIGGGESVVTIGTPFDSARGWSYNKLYGGEVYGACRGKSDLDPNQFANSVWTKVNIFDKATIMGNVFGGGDSGIVKKDAEVEVGATATD